MPSENVGIFIWLSPISPTPRSSILFSIPIFLSIFIPIFLSKALDNPNKKRYNEKWSILLPTMQKNTII